jgi:hypothetical protein
MAYTYTFTRGEKTIEARGYNLWSGAKNAGLTIVRTERLSIHYLQSTPFDRRERIVWCAGEMGGQVAWKVNQRKINYTE